MPRRPIHMDLATKEHIVDVLDRWIQSDDFRTSVPKAQLRDHVHMKLATTYGETTTPNQIDRLMVLIFSGCGRQGWFKDDDGRVHRPYVWEFRDRVHAMAFILKSREGLQRLKMADVAPVVAGDFT